jgi:hypothetical protein
MATDQDYNEMSNTFNQIKDDERTPDVQDETEAKERAAAITLSPYQTDIGTKLDQEWLEAESERTYAERRMLRDLRQYRGQYDPEVLRKIHPNRSKAYIRLTRTKVKTFDARMMDLQFPSNEDKNWGMQPTPVPELSGPVVQSIAQQIYEQTGQIPTEKQVEDIVVKQADKQAKSMEKEIADQLAEFDYRETIRNVLHSGHVFGTGVLKGPMVKEVTSKRWYQDQKGDWKQVKIKRLIPTAQFVPIWDIYPDMSAKEKEHCRYIWQKHLFSKNRLTVLSKRTDFNTNAITTFIEAYPDGNAVYKSYEEDLREMSTNSEADGDSSPPKREKYEVHERWGFMDIEDAKELLPNIEQEVWDSMGPEVACNIWMLENIIIKAVISPVEGADIPYYFYYFDKDETSIFGDGVPRIMRDPQMLYNAAIRAMLDNAAISAGPIIEANIDLLADGEDPLALFPFRVFQRTGTGIDANQQAIRVTKLPSYTNEFLNLVSFFQDTADESTTIPRTLHGGTDIPGGAANQTATGMSMLIGASNITLKDQVQFFDDGVTRPFIKAMYFWNMEFNNKENIKGDYNVVARGTKSLIAKEVKMEQINQFLALTNNEIDLQYIKRDVLLRELAEIFDLNRLGFIRTEQEVAAASEANAAKQEKQMQVEMLLEAMKAESSGHVPDAVEKTKQILGMTQPGGAEPIPPTSMQEKQIG